VADYDAGLQVIDISTPSSPTLVGGYDTSGWAIGVAVSGSYAYVADYDAGLQVIDISTPSSPTLVGGYDTSGYACGVAVSGDYAYVADYDAGLVILRVGAAPPPAISAIAPTSAPNSGSVNISDLAGTDFQTGATVKLTRAEETDIAATGVVVVSASKITCSFNLTGKAAGQWNVVATNPDAQSATLTNGFTITDGLAPVIGSVAVSPLMSAAGDAVHVVVEVTDETEVTSVAANETPLTRSSGPIWSGDIIADPVLGFHPVTVVARDAANNSATDNGLSYKTAQVIFILNRDLVRDVTAGSAGQYLFITWGRVTWLDADTFELEDGSGTPVRVSASGHGLETNDFAFARGTWSLKDPHTLYSSSAWITPIE